MSKSVSYLALGDSYTIGEEVPLENSFPYQLADILSKNGYIVNRPEIIATTGWTTNELQDAIAKSGLNQKFDLVTLLIGVNNQYRGESLKIYREEFKALLQTAINFTNGNKARVFVLSIPDWGVTPYAVNSGRDPELIAKEIDNFNAINYKETISLGVNYTNVTTSSRKAGSETDLLTNDGLHYSAKMYAEWVELLKQEIIKVI
ncbi:GDSL-type esterase/lipase family protein [Pedobacter sp. ASV1-7]|uniref:SGNH/GDSL hydrolase family protein n=1 Tax=Pedobacter sp. ASV1-7 TaxID=3145237 RepID=UPI0032E8E1D0